MLSGGQVQPLDQGLIVANDADTSRCYMLVHRQPRRFTPYATPYIPPHLDTRCCMLVHQLPRRSTLYFLPSPFSHISTHATCP